MDRFTDEARKLMQDIPICRGWAETKTAIAAWGRSIAAEARKEAFAEAARIVEAEPELPGDMPDNMWAAIKDDKDASTQSHRLVVMATKGNILKAMEAKSKAVPSSEEKI